MFPGFVASPFIRNVWACGVLRGSIFDSYSSSWNGVSPNCQCFCMICGSSEWASVMVLPRNSEGRGLPVFPGTLDVLVYLGNKAFVSKDDATRGGLATGNQSPAARDLNKATLLLCACEQRTHVSNLNKTNTSVSYEKAGFM